MYISYVVYILYIYCNESFPSKTRGNILNLLIRWGGEGVGKVSTIRFHENILLIIETEPESEGSKHCPSKCFLTKFLQNVFSTISFAMLALFH